MLYSSKVRKKLDAATKTQSRTSNRTASTETFSLVGTNVSNDDYKSDKSHCYQKSPRTQIIKSSKSETTHSINQHNRSSSSQPQSFRSTRKSTTTSNESSILHNTNNIVEEEEDVEFQRLSSKLRSTFIDVIESSPSRQSKSGMDLVDMIKSQFDTQTVRIRRLERALKEKEDQLIKSDTEDTLALLLKRYPNAMQSYRKQIEEDQFNQQLEACIEQFEAQKQKMILEHQRNFEILKLKYRNRFDDIVERMISDPSRLDDEWARRVQREADDRVEEIKRKYSKR